MIDKSEFERASRLEFETFQSLIGESFEIHTLDGSLCQQVRLVKADRLGFQREASLNRNPFSVVFCGDSQNALVESQLCRIICPAFDPVILFVNPIADAGQGNGENVYEVIID